MLFDKALVMQHNSSIVPVFREVNRRRKIDMGEDAVMQL